MVRVKCGQVWHEVMIAPHGLATLHTDEEIRREAALSAPSGCFRALSGWATGVGWLPRELRHERNTFLSLAARGKVFELECLVADGFDPRVRGFGGRSALHYLAALREAESLPWLLSFGLDVNLRDAEGRAPLHMTDNLRKAWTVRELLSAGADPRLTDHRGETPLQRFRRAWTVHHGADPEAERLLASATGAGR